MEEELETVSQVVCPEESILLNAPKGCLLARIPMINQLSSDFPSGKLILRSSTHVLLRAVGQHPEQKPHRIYEAQMILMDNYGIDGRGRDYMYVSLSLQFINDYVLEDKSKIRVEIQFQMNRVPLCQMHYAVDMLNKSHNIPRIFPKNITYQQNLEYGQQYGIE